MNDTLPNALMIGVDYELFWTLNPKSLKPFIKAFSLQQKHEDVIAWRNGLYIRMAIASCLNKDSKYPTQALMFDSEITDTDRQKSIKDKFIKQMKIINKRFE